MTQHIERRTVLQGAAGLMVAQIALSGTAASAVSPLPQPLGKAVRRRRLSALVAYRGLAVRAAKECATQSAE